MDEPKADSPDSKSNSETPQPSTEETIMTNVARGVGTAMGVIATSAAKVMGKTEAPEPDAKPKRPREKAREKNPKSASSDGSQDKHAAGRLAKKKKKRAAHRAKLKRSNTKG